MAKAKKSKLSIEEMLVSTDLQPYEIPENWCWIHLLDSFDNVTDSKKKLATKEYLEEGAYPIIDQGQDFIGGYTDDESMIYDGELPIVIFGDHTRCMKYINFPFTQGADGVKVLKPKKFWDAKAFYYAMQSVEIPNMGYRRHYPLFKDFCIPVPPLAEQKRIVEQIEKLFSKLDEAKEKVQQVIDSYDDRRAAILHVAFNGELTSNWRMNNNIDISSWKSTTISGIAELVTKGASPRWQGVEYLDDDTQTLFVTSENVREGYLDLSKEKYLDNKINEIQKRSVLKKGDVLVNIVGASIGRSAIYNIDKLANTNQAVCLIRLNDVELNQYVCFYLNSPVALRYYSDNKSETARANLSLTDINNLPINIPSKLEANEIMKVVDAILDKEKRVLDSALLTLEQIDLIKKSILAKAFRGELGTNIADEESSFELLKQIIES